MVRKIDKKMGGKKMMRTFLRRGANSLHFIRVQELRPLGGSVFATVYSKDQSVDRAVFSQRNS